MNQVRFEDGRPVAVGGQELAQPSRYVRTKAGFWGLYAVGDQALVVSPGGAFRGEEGEVARRLREIATGERGWSDDDRAAAGALLHQLTEAGKGTGPTDAGPRSPSEQGTLPPTYWLSGETNTPG